ncbi:uncharacterized protein HRG_06291 [Hirsutella rhossiliensis]|uniref:AB hydrolase-1 domain-containing protein n=1 Tax=Hirsutella rhossiliensis TaxID=111463 RepID=A0A9P8MXG4_9HYPO|nr:uncharacterized protein HRG_06291 [Hirsutella rhossiliensis]KAH0962189.1 hypothetical protein HRG_06291 [Hirsutella rhossiliensis]
MPSSNDGREPTSSPPGGSNDHDAENSQNPPSNQGQQVAPAGAIPVSMLLEQPLEGAFSTRTTFFVEADWPGGSDRKAGKRTVGRMYVECLDPLLVVHGSPIILVHGDWHTGQIWTTKPDGKPGWASYFNYQGYRVYVVDLPPCGRSNLLSDGQFQQACEGSMIDASLIERDVTAPGKQDEKGWDTAGLHSQWPGTGQRGDAAFESYLSSMVPLPLKKADRQALAQSALSQLLERTGRAILIGEGSGATMAWLAADAKPDLVAGVLAVEPAGPPAGTACTYGLADIPLTYEPPLEPKSPGSATGSDETGLDLVPKTLFEGEGTCILQRCSGCEDGDKKAKAGEDRVVRQLVNLQKMPHAILTGEASSHSKYDWATAEYMRQAGVLVQKLPLERYHIGGNGHLMFLEKNSENIAGLITIWIDSCVRKGPSPAYLLPL